MTSATSTSISTFGPIRARFGVSLKQALPKMGRVAVMEQLFMNVLFCDPNLVGRLIFLRSSSSTSSFLLPPLAPSWPSARSPGKEIQVFTLAIQARPENVTRSLECIVRIWYRSWPRDHHGSLHHQGENFPGVVWGLGMRVSFFTATA